MSCEHDLNFPTETIVEGNVKALVPMLKAFVKMPSEYAPSKAPVFYNPVMELNRDIAVLAVQAYQKMLQREISVCEPLTGCGLRGVRFAAEVEGVAKVLMGDINERAFRLANRNVAINSLSDRASVKREEANILLSSHGAPRERFDVIDVDPFGSPVPFLDSSLRALRDGGLLALTATDMAPLCGVHPKACIRRYGGKPLRTEYCHELAVRLLAGCLASTAAKQDIGVDIVFSHRAEHYIRVYATIAYGAKFGDESLKNMGYVLHCFKCLHRESFKGIFEGQLRKTCPECGSSLSAAGPLWLGKISDAKMCRLMGQEAEQRKLRLGNRIRRMLFLLESESDTPASYYVVDKFCDALGLPVPSVKKVVEALQREGFGAWLTHFNERGVRTEASARKISDLLYELTSDKS